jgi:hypothetical protein|tara:strand:- start:251 stop:658 length:408 start_codon:yes stop_codon:yes gene_type:complete
MSNFKVVTNVTIVNSRIVTPVTRDFGNQYTLLVSGEGIEEVGGSLTKDGQSYWLNTNANYANGDPIAPPMVINRSKQPITTELGEGSEVELAFKIARTAKGTFYNLAAIKVLRLVKPFNMADVFDSEVESAIDAF